MIPDYSFIASQTSRNIIKVKKKASKSDRKKHLDVSVLRQCKCNKDSPNFLFLIGYLASVLSPLTA